jgi:hypothetical protein
MINMAVLVWAVVGVFTFVVDCVMSYRRLAGKLGEHVRTEYAEAWEQLGGMLGMMTLGLLFDIAIPPIGIWGLVSAYVRDWRKYQSELLS